jgi:hypothetical protein
LLIKLVSSQYRLRFFFYHILWIFRGPLLFPLKGTRPIAGLKWNRYQPRSCFFWGGAPIYLWYKDTNAIPDDHFFSSTNFPNFSTSTSYYFPLKMQCPIIILPNSGCRNLHPDLGKKKMTIS